MQVKYSALLILCSFLFVPPASIAQNTCVPLVQMNIHLILFAAGKESESQHLATILLIIVHTSKDSLNS